MKGIGEMVSDVGTQRATDECILTLKTFCRLLDVMIVLLVFLLSTTNHIWPMHRDIQNQIFIYFFVLTRKMPICR